MPYFIAHEAAARLCTLALSEARPVLTTLARDYAPHMAALDHLVLNMSPVLEPGFTFDLLGSLSRSLATLDISGEPFGLPLAEAVARCLREGLMCVRTLQVL